MKSLKKIITACLMLVATLPLMQAEHLVVLAVNDTHSQIDPAADGKGGILRRRAIYDSERRAHKNVLVVHAGDAVQGTNYFSLYGGAVEYAAIDSLGYDMIIMGNHELDNGIDSLAHFYNHVKATKLSANYDLSASPLKGFVPYSVRAYGNKRVAFFGINVNPAGMVSQGHYNGLRFLEPMQVADATARYLKQVQKVDYVVMISHIGYDSMEPSEPNDSIVAATSHYIDFIIGGHSHSVIAPGSKQSLVHNADGKIVVIGQNGKSGKLVGKYDLDLETGKVTYSHITVDNTWDRAAQAYPAFQSWLARYKAGVDSLENNPVATSARYMPNSSWAAQNWLADAVDAIIAKLYKGGKKVDLCIMNKGGIRLDMPKGTVTEGLLQSMFPFDNRFMVLEVSGQDLLDAFKTMAYRGGDVVSRNVKVVYDKNCNIVSARINGKAVKPAARYLLATIDFLYNGGDYMTSLKNGKVLYKDDQRYGRHMLDYVKSLSQQGKTIDASDEPRFRQR